MNLSVETKRFAMPLFWVVAVALGYAITRNQGVVATVAAVAMLVVLATVFKPEDLILGAAVLLPFRVLESLVPISRGGVTIADAFLLAFIVSALARKRVHPGRRVSTIVVIVLVALIAVGTASLLAGGFYGVGIRKVGRIAVICLSFYAALRSLDARDAERAAGAFVISSALSSIVALGFTLRAAAVPGVGVLRLWGGVEDPNHMSVVLAAAFVIALAWRPKGVPPGVWMGSSILLLFAQAASLSRGGAGALAAGVIVMLALAAWARFRGRQVGVLTRSGALLVLLAAGAALAATFVPPDLTGAAVLRYQGILDPTTDATGSLRLRIWEAGGRMLAASPILGVGPGAFGLALVASGAFTVPWEAHSSLVEIAVETGYLGIGVVALALVVGGILSVRSFIAAVRDPSVSIERISLASGLVGAAGGTIVGGITLSNVLYQPLLATMIVLLIATLAHQEEVS